MIGAGLSTTLIVLNLRMYLHSKTLFNFHFAESQTMADAITFQML